MKKNGAVFAVYTAAIAAIYVVLCMLSSLLGLSSGIIQLRLSEILCLLPIFTPAAVPGLALGCLISNILSGGVPLDIVFGTAATLLGALGTAFLRKCSPFIAMFPPILANAIIVPLVLRFGYLVTSPLWFTAATVAAGEIIMCYGGCFALYAPLKRNKRIFEVGYND